MKHLGVALCLWVGAATPARGDVLPTLGGSPMPLGVWQTLTPGVYQWVFHLKKHEKLTVAARWPAPSMARLELKVSEVSLEEGEPEEALAVRELPIAVGAQGSTTAVVNPEGIDRTLRIAVSTFGPAKTSFQLRVERVRQARR